jgi:hypothetical protein
MGSRKKTPAGVTPTQTDILKDIPVVNLTTEVEVKPNEFLHALAGQPRYVKFGMKRKKHTKKE